MATDVKNYYISDKALVRESYETLEALDDLMREVDSIPGIQIFSRKLNHPLKGTKVVIVKELADA